MAALFTSGGGATAGASAGASVGASGVGSSAGLLSFFESAQNSGPISGITSIFQALNDERDARSQAARIDFIAKQEELRGRQDTVKTLQVLNDLQASNVVSGFASGTDISGSRGRVTQDLNRSADFAETIIRTNAEIRSSDLKQEAQFIRKTARFNRNVAVGKSLFRIVGVPV